MIHPDHLKPLLAVHNVHEFTGKRLHVPKHLRELHGSNRVTKTPDRDRK